MIKVTKIKPEFVDERGQITRIVDQIKHPIRSVLYITSKKGTERGNHYHKKDYHFVYCLSGKFKYIEKVDGKKSDSVILKPGDLVLTRPFIQHAMVFLEDTVFLAITTEGRNNKSYERDTVRIQVSHEH